MIYWVLVLFSSCSPIGMTSFPSLIYNPKLLRLFPEHYSSPLNDVPPSSEHLLSDFWVDLSFLYVPHKTTYINTKSESSHKPKIFIHPYSVYYFTDLRISLFPFLLLDTFQPILSHISSIPQISSYCWMNIFDWYQPNLTVCTHFQNVHRDYTVG